MQGWAESNLGCVQGQFQKHKTGGVSSLPSKGEVQEAAKDMTYWSLSITQNYEQVLKVESDTWIMATGENGKLIGNRKLGNREQKLENRTKVI